MNIYEITVSETYLVDGLQQQKNKVVKVKLPSGPSEIKGKQWAEFHERRNAMPAWFTEPEEGQVLTAEQSQQFYLYMAELVSCFMPDNQQYDLMDLLSIKGARYTNESLDSVMAVYVHFFKLMAEYKPKPITQFKYKGNTYVLPKSLYNTFGAESQEIVGGAMKTYHAIEALQVEFVMTSKNDAGDFVMDKRKFNRDIGIAAAVARLVTKNPGGKKVVEKIPSNYEERFNRLRKRMRHFQDLPLSVMLDIGFFLTGGKLLLPSYLVLVQHLTEVRMQALKTLQQSRKAKTTGKAMAGTLYLTLSQRGAGLPSKGKAQ